MFGFREDSSILQVYRENKQRKKHVLCCLVFYATHVWCFFNLQQVVRHLMERAGEAGDGGCGGGGEKFEGVKVICYDSAAWVRKNFKAKVDKHNEVGLRRGM